MLMSRRQLDTDSAEDDSATYSIASEFRAIYGRFGGEASLGLPISLPIYLGDSLVQYFGCGRLDLTGRSEVMPLGSVELTELGVLLGAATRQDLNTTFEPIDYLPQSEDVAYFASSGHTLGSEFKEFWYEHGGLERFGPPISNAVAKKGHIEQWFTKARLEYAGDQVGSSLIRIANIGHEFLALSPEERRAYEYQPEPQPVVEPSSGLDVPIAYYHRVEDRELFERQVLGLLDGGYEPIPLARLIRALAGQASLPDKSIIFTFDDGLESQLHLALPVLIKYRVPASFFVMPSFHTKEPGHLDLEAFRILADAGMSVQSHSLNHADLPRLIVQDLGAARAETVESKAALRELGGGDFFAYPYGAVDDAAEQLIRDSGYLAALSTDLGRVHFPDEIFHLKRVPLHSSADPEIVLNSLERALSLDPRMAGNIALNS